MERKKVPWCVPSNRASTCPVSYSISVPEYLSFQPIKKKAKIVMRVHKILQNMERVLKLEVSEDMLRLHKKHTSYNHEVAWKRILIPSPGYKKQSPLQSNHQNKKPIKYQ